MYLNKFQQGDKVSYVGSKFASELSGKPGVILSRVHNAQQEVVVSFGSDAYIMDEGAHLVKFNGREATPRVEGDETVSAGGKVEKKVSGPEVQKRKGVGAGKRSTK